MTKLHNDLLRDIGTLARTIHYLHDLHFKELALQAGTVYFSDPDLRKYGYQSKRFIALIKSR